MSESDFVTAMHKTTGLVTDIPRHYLDLFPYREVSEAELVQLRREAEKAQFGEYRTPAPAKAKAIEDPVKEGK